MLETIKIIVTVFGSVVGALLIGLWIFKTYRPDIYYQRNDIFVSKKEIKEAGLDIEKMGISYASDKHHLFI